MKKLFAIVAALFASLLMVSSAQAGNETVEATTDIQPKSGQFFQEAPKVAELKIRADVHAPETEVKVTPMKNTKITFPQGLTFNPNNKLTPPCTDAMLSPDSTFLATPGEVVAACEKSVVGTGTSDIFLGAFRAAPRPAILIIFNAGKSNSGNSKIKIYGYAPVTNVGIIMTGELKGRVLDVKIPVLSSDSAVRYYEFHLPGGNLDVPPGIPSLDGKNVRGLDPNYVKAICPASGKLITNADFLMGTRDFATGQDTGPTIPLSSPQGTQDCTGLKGKAKLRAQVKGPKAVKNGAKGVFRVTLKNNGTASVKSVRITAKGGGKASVAKIAPGASKTVKVKTKVTGRKGKKVNIKFTAKGKGAKASAVAKVKVK